MVQLLQYRSQQFQPKTVWLKKVGFGQTVWLQAATHLGTDSHWAKIVLKNTFHFNWVVSWFSSYKNSQLNIIVDKMMTNKRNVQKKNVNQVPCNFSKVDFWGVNEPTKELFLKLIFNNLVSFLLFSENQKVQKFKKLKTNLRLV